MSTALAQTHNTKGVRQLSGTRQRQVAGLGSLDPDLVQAMIGAGYDPAILSTLDAMGATDDQVENLFLSGADPSTLINQLGGATPAPGGNATQAGSYPAGAVPSTVSTAFGIYDLTQEATWSQFNSIFSSVKEELQSVARKFPGDADTAQHIQEFNSTVMQYANYYEELFGSAPPNIPLASTTGLGGLGVFPILAVAGIAAAIVAILATAYAIHQWATVKLAQAPAQTAVANAQSTQAQNQSQLVSQYRALVAAGNTQAANALLPTLTAMGINPNASMDWNAWFQQNMFFILAGVAAVVVLPPLIKKL